MTEPSATPTSGGDARTKPLLIVAAVAILAFGIAFVAFRGGGSSNSSPNPTVAAPARTAGAVAQGSQGSQSCGDGQQDAGYSVTMTTDPNPPRAEGTTFHLVVRHDGKPVTGAAVCLTADMTEMHHEGINNLATETSGGAYDTRLTFGMRGPYAGTVIVTEPGKAAVAVPVTFPVN